MEKETPRATAYEFAKRAEMEAQLSVFARTNEAGFDELNEMYMDFCNSYSWEAYCFSDNGKHGIKSADGRVLVPAQYEDLHFYPMFAERINLVAACKGGKWAAVKADGSGEAVTPFEYDSIAPVGGSLIAASKDGKSAYIDTNDLNGPRTTPFHFDQIVLQGDCLFMNGWSIFKKDGRYGVTDGTDYSEPAFDQIDYITPDTFIEGTLNGVTGYLDIEGRFTTDENEAYYFAFQYEMIDED